MALLVVGATVGAGYLIGCGESLLGSSEEVASPPDYAPRVVRTALDDWTAPWIAQADGECAPAPQRWLVLGWDGADWDLILPLLEAGRLPYLAELMRTGAYGNMSTISPTVSPVVWTSIATGRSPRDHGISGFLREGSDDLARGTDRQVKAIWELLTEAGRASVVVGYHNTFPVEPIVGAMLSNYMVQSYFHEELFSGAWPGAREALVSPPELLPDVLALEETIQAALAENIARFVALDGPEALEPYRTASNVREAGAYWREGVRRGYTFDSLNGSIARAWIPQLGPDLAMVHFQSIDWACHRFLYFHAPDDFADIEWSPEIRREMDERAKMYTKTVTAFYEFVDEWTGQLLADLDESTAVLIVSDHGFEADENPSISGEHTHAPPGIIVVNGPGIKRGVRLDATVYDVFPTLAVTLGLPLAEDLAGRVLDELFCAGAPSQSAARVASYGPRDSNVTGTDIPSQVEDDIRENLRSLGYLQ